MSIDTKAEAVASPAQGTPAPRDSGLEWRNITYDIPLPRKQRKAALAASANGSSEKASPAANSADQGNGVRELKAGDRRILNNISGHVGRGEMLAILGASGAGKTTLQSILSARLGSVGTLSGTVTFDGKQRNPNTWKRSTAFVEQDDCLIGQLTVEETLRFAARLRLPNAAYTRAQKDERADQVLDMLRLNTAAETFIGNGLTRGVSGGERKRVSIACELVTEPQLLILDEPTSGLDSFAAYNVVDNVRSITRRTNISTLLTIHQPSYSVFCLADRVMLLARGGVFYDGPPGEPAAKYFSALGYSPGEGVNPADYYLELVSNLERNEEGEARITRLLDAWQDQIKKGPIKATQPSDGELTKATAPGDKPSPSSDQSTVVASSPGVEKNGILPEPGSKEAEDKRAVVADKYSTWPITWPEELMILTHRHFLQQIRDRELLIGTQAQSIVLLIIIGLAFLRLGLDNKDVLARIGALFVIPTNASFAVLFPVISIFPLQRQVMLRERSAGVYRTSAFFFSKILTEIPGQVLQRVFFYLVVYWMVGLQPRRYGVWIAVNLLQVACSVSLGLFVGAVSPTLNVANIIAPLINVTFLLFAPTILPNPPPWFIWIRYISPLTYTVMALLQNEMHGLVFRCSPGETQCYANGEAVLDSYGLTTFTVAECIGFVFAITFAFLFMGYLGLRIVAKPRFRYTNA
ncbi:hypothetical protein OC846_004139 [Tilletia horrida]|uniref:ABC transporter domain-containing protein n=1 Tax=Tilletia horrida TaxID=155126 RepID=A0AAN6JXA4_9BASI|nr:hypothetical protein OC845_004230 [Tilletia horrida]KAK0549313.1 hypothetical protein OC846_004139 [Tilletia horrida]KAK0564139.1 hypothetical protein OC861_004452 [Tilletia horrida]